MAHLRDTKIAALVVSLLCHMMVVTGFAAGVPAASKSIISVSRTIAVQLDLLQPAIKNSVVSASLGEISQRLPIRAESEKIVPSPKEKIVEDPAALQKRAELDRRIKDIRAKLKRTVKKQQLKRAADVQKGFQIVSLEKKGPEWEGYIRQIRSKVLERWYPKLVKFENSLVKSEAQLNFEILCDGTVKSYEVVQWKGSEEFKKISLEAFREAMPFESFGRVGSNRDSQKKFSLTLFFYYQ